MQLSKKYCAEPSAYRAATATDHARLARCALRSVVADAGGGCASAAGPGNSGPDHRLRKSDLRTRHLASAAAQPHVGEQLRIARWIGGCRTAHRRGLAGTAA
ncbi:MULTISPECIES: hypothetical protein [unclassified Streptomyces]|uniref:Uncharacterized protein n=1 Tax=Streptomyces sp. NBC_00060 TaxID=2975636 RepID=A0AAU2HD30_9ACTN